ncbi:member Ras oncogene family RAB32 [Tupanvirus deep ocean]|uniref:Member Ras oncogene family RAB32 n=2 Tax=Tupanvirus TaxID=2094720 RepID=A0AC62A8Q8_9VIRU|nr:member Ras oncogene family RAB32 [Tupanvirus deep ocean]QKU34156.1 member Ras oncogene family RAB32 [Tupanvirus deep ocean]
MENCKCKILFLGAPEVGKTSFIRKYVHNIFPINYRETRGIDYSEKRKVIENSNVFIELWDIAGKELTGLYNRIYYKGASVAVVFFDITNKDSLEIAKKWKQDVQNKYTDIPLILVANKCDAPLEKHIITESELKLFSDNEGFLTYFCISVKLDDINIIIEFVVLHYLLHLSQQTDKIIYLDIANEHSNKKSKCY